MLMRSTAKQFVVCLENDGYEVSLERRKIYRVLPDSDAAKHRLIRVIDESGEPAPNMRLKNPGFGPVALYCTA